jgi:hypothetical protein
VLNWQQHASKISAGRQEGLAIPFSSILNHLALHWQTWFGISQSPHLDYLETPILYNHAVLVTTALAAVGFCGCGCAPHLAFCWPHGFGAAPSAHSVPLATICGFGDTAVYLVLQTRIKTIATLAAAYSLANGFLGGSAV